MTQNLHHTEPRASVFASWLPEIAAQSLVVGDIPADLIREARGNLWTFTVPQATQTEDMRDFLQAVVAARERQIITRFGTRHPMTFYAWFDEQASQLRFSLVSAFHRQLPFGVPLVLVELSVIVEQFIRSPYRDEIPFAELQVVTYDFAETEEPYVLPVWVVQLPTTSGDPTV